MNYLGDFAGDETLPIFFNTFDSVGGSVTLTGLAVTDIEIYKDGGTTQRTSDAGYTLLDTDGTDFDTITGIHGFSVDLSDNTDAGFFVAGSDYTVIVSAVTIDSQTVSFIAGSFSIQNRFMRGTDSAALASALVTVDTNVDAILVDTGTILPATLAGLNDPTTAAIADAIWDEALSGHNTGGTTGKAMRQLTEGTVSAESTINDAGATTTTFITALTEVTDDHYIDVSVVFIDGALIGQSRPILSYNGTTKTIVLDEALTEAPANGDGFIIKTDHVHPVSQIADGILLRQITESYAADGVAPTVAQALMLIQQILSEYNQDSTTITIKKLDGSTIAMTLTLDNATNPTSVTRTT